MHGASSDCLKVAGLHKTGGEQKKPKSGKCGKPFCRMPLQAHIHMPMALKVNELCSGNSRSRSRRRSSAAKQRSNK